MWRGPIVIAAGSLALSACVTPQMHSDAQLNSAGSACGLRLGELIQDESEKRLLLMIRNEPSAEQRVCVTKWARRNGLKAVFVQLDLPQS